MPSRATAAGPANSELALEGGEEGLPVENQTQKGNLKDWFKQRG